MKNRNLRIVVFLGLSLIVLASCGNVPSATIPEVSFLEVIEEFVRENNEYTYALWDGQEGVREARRERQEESEDEQRVIVFRAGDKVIFRRTPLWADGPSPPISARPHLVLGMIDSTDFLTLRPLSLTYRNDDTGLISLDNHRTWYSFGGGGGPPGSQNSRDSDEGPVEVPLLRDWFSLNPRPSNENTLDLEMKWASFREFRDPVLPYDEWAPSNRQVSGLIPGGVIDSSEKKEITLDLRENILRVPSNTLLDGKFSIEGNLLEAKTYPDRFEIRVQRDFWVYTRSPRNVSVSFDRLDWRNFIWDFEFKNTQVSKVTGPRSIEAQFEVLFSLKRDR